jgi:hypothetical protein
MKKQTIITLTIFTIGLWLPITCLAHHMGQGYGSAPDVVDDYAHGVNAQSDNQSGTNVGMSDEDENMGSYGAAGDSTSNGPASSMQGADSYGSGVAGEGSDYAGTGDFGDASAGVGSGGSDGGGSDGGGSSGGGSSGDSDSGSGSGSGSGNGSGAGKGRA